MARGHSQRWILLLAALVHALLVPCHAQTQIVRVRSAAALADAVRSGSKHVLVEQHLVILNRNNVSGVAPAAEENEDYEPPAAFAFTTPVVSVRGECGQQPPSGIQLSHSKQCVIETHLSLFNASRSDGALVWIDNVYLFVNPQMPVDLPVLLLEATASNLWLTRSVFVGDQMDSRAIDLGPGHTLYAHDCTFQRFAKLAGAAMRLYPGSSSVLHNCSFSNNEVRGSPEAAGPVAALLVDTAAGDDDQAPAAWAWFHDCTFGSFIAPTGTDVVIQDGRCRTYSNKKKTPAVFDANFATDPSKAMLSPWHLEAVPRDFEPEDVFEGRPFPAPEDPRFRDLITEWDTQANLSLTDPAPQPLPDRTRLAARASLVNVQNNSNRNLIIGMAAALVAVCVLAAATLWWWTRGSKVDAGHSSNTVSNPCFEP